MFINLLESQLMKISHGKQLFYIDKISKKISAGLSGLQMYM